MAEAEVLNDPPKATTPKQGLERQDFFFFFNSKSQLSKPSFVILHCSLFPLATL